ncbi:MAG: endolytic transglycosylase MltG [Balneolaceae bacterium]|nr:endolytic transglycosylase MltG [Balneolaceae bacterium]
MDLSKHIPFNRWELILGVLIVVLITAAIGGSRLSRLFNTQAVSSVEPVHIYLHDKTDLYEMSSILADSGVVIGQEELLWAGRLLGWRNFLPGHYEIQGSYSYDVFLSKMARGIQDPVSVTIIPGSSEERILRVLSTRLKADSVAFHHAVEDSSFWENRSFERKDFIGRMYPSTYSFYWTSSPKTIFNRIFREFEKEVAEGFEFRIREVDLTLDEVVTLASIIEWEAMHEDEKPKISGLYWNRLNKRMYLQADPTVVFALGERRRLLYEDYEIDHPYNTYNHFGLPPGPITNPNKNSIEAALYPQDHDYLFMVASPEGYHIFSETFSEHKEKSVQWRRWIREQYRKKKLEEVRAEEKEVNS